MSQGPYRDSYLPVSRAADAVQNQSDTILSELHGSIDRAKAFKAKLATRALEEAQKAWQAKSAMETSRPAVKRPVCTEAHLATFAQTIAWWGGVR